MEKQRLHYYEQLAELYPTIGKASTEIINLQSILYLPKGTEHFLSDIHGEFKAFSHVLRNGSGAVRKKCSVPFGRYKIDCRLIISVDAFPIVGYSSASCS